MSRKPRRKCSTAHCRNLAAVRKNGKPYGGKCHGCRTASWRSNQPMRAAYLRLKSHAADRLIEFTISFQEFEAFAKRTDYLNRTGPFGSSLTVDRKNNLLGYIPGNIRPLSRSANSLKKAKHDQIRMEKGHGWQTKYACASGGGDFGSNPF